MAVIFYAGLSFKKLFFFKKILKEDLLKELKDGAIFFFTRMPLSMSKKLCVMTVVLSNKSCRVMCE